MKFILAILVLLTASVSFAKAQKACGKIERIIMFPHIVTSYTHDPNIGVVALEVPLEDQNRFNDEKSYVGFITDQWQAVRITEYRDSGVSICIETVRKSAQIIDVYEEK